MDTAKRRVVLAGQSFDSTSEFAVGQAPGSWSAPVTRIRAATAWLERLEAFEPRRVLLAHDVVIWQRGAPYTPPSVPSVASR